ncbi:GNAT family N-acyltransferase [Methylocaldum sp.]|uniref:GNAT family N-acyltransferase n=1 Tax=Methylocaldum sp. TaxID=1969727 RepID=UPI002D7496E7|nr:GNAT family N-acyltransferase [Methylocaldum sp.]HYE36522.1 GNAT family N-acyltransferase [Methylocaldum sp.]
MFDTRYEVVLANTPESKEIHFNLRYKVFCLEKGFEDAGKFTAQMEQDQYDSQAIHFLVRERLRNGWIGAARLIIDKMSALPMTNIVDIEVPGTNNNAMAAEFSRLLVLDNFRQPQAKVAAEPEILLGLIRAARDYCLQRNIKSVLFLCRRSIYRILGNTGIDMLQIGSPCIHRGVRAPYLVDLDTGFDRVFLPYSRAYQMFSRAQSYCYYSDLYGRQVA